MQPKWLTCLLLLPTLLAPALHAAEPDEEPRQFDIEVLLFTHVNAYGGGETWPQETPQELPIPEFGDSPATDTGAEAEPAGLPRPDAATTAAPDWIPLPANARRLDAIETALQRSGGYQPLAHLLWRQTVLEPDAARPIDVLTLQGHAAAEPAPLPRVEGSLRISVSRYLHVETDLRLIDASLPYTPPSLDSPPAENSGVPVYRMQQRRRMRSGELHYLDHPRFGMLVQITPYTPPEPVAIPEPAPAPEGVSPAESTPPLPVTPQ